MSWRRLLGFVAVWFVLAVPLWCLIFVRSEAFTVVAGHDAIVRPTFDHHVRLETGAYLPDLRMRSDTQIGVRIQVGKTTAANTNEIVERYALIANHPEVEVRAVSREVKALAFDAALRAGVLAVLPIGGWVLIGERRRAELRHPTRKGLAIVGGLALVAGFVVWQPWRPDLPRVGSGEWIDLADAVPELRVPDELQKVQVEGGALTASTRKLVASALDYYDRSKVFYNALVDKAPALAAQLHQPADGETVAVLVSDRHDNIGMDEVVRTVADEAGATAIIDAGDDTSTGESWEAFSLESLDDVFADYDTRIAISGNHDHGRFVSSYLEKRGWTHLDRIQAEAFGVRFYGVDDPRSSGLGAYRDVPGPTFAEVEEQTADDVCALDDKGERVATLVVHDANLGRTALARGCVDLVVAGHLHVQVGPDRVLGENGKAGYSYTNGTTGGAAFAVAVGGKLRREAEFTFVTYADGRPVGIQPVTVSTRGLFTVGAYQALDLG